MSIRTKNINKQLTDKKAKSTSNNHTSDSDSLKCKKIGNYILTKTLGKGTFGKVQTGIHCLTQKKVAVKILDKDKIKEQTDVERIIREIKILKKIRHINVIQLFDTISTKRHFYLITEFIKGGDLYDYLSTKNSLTEREICHLYQQLIAAVEYIHKLGIVHRDIKPENILVDYESQTLKLVDFGLSNMYENGQKLKTPCGSPCYAAPEMIAGKEYNGLLSDIWSSGVVLYCMLCGELPFDDTNIKSLYHKITNGLYTIPSFLSPEAQDLLRNILNINVDKRYNITKIKQHPWFNIEEQTVVDEGLFPDLNSIQVDEEVLDLMIENFFSNEVPGPSKSEIKENISRNKHNEITTAYYLTLNETKSRNHSKDCYRGNNALSISGVITDPLKVNHLNKTYEAKEKNARLVASTGGEVEVESNSEKSIKHQYNEKGGIIKKLIPNKESSLKTKILKDNKSYSNKIASIIQGTKNGKNQINNEVISSVVNRKTVYPKQQTTIVSNQDNKNENNSELSNLITPSSHNNKDSSSFNKESITININIDKKNDKKIKVFQTININQIIKNLHQRTSKIQSNNENVTNTAITKAASSIQDKTTYGSIQVKINSKSKSKDKPNSSNTKTTEQKPNEFISIRNKLNFKPSVSPNKTTTIKAPNVTSVVSNPQHKSTSSNTNNFSKSIVQNILKKNTYLSNNLNSRNNQSFKNQNNITVINNSNNNHTLSSIRQANKTPVMTFITSGKQPAEIIKDSINLKRKTNSFSNKGENLNPQNMKQILPKKQSQVTSFNKYILTSPNNQINNSLSKNKQSLNKTIFSNDQRPASTVMRKINDSSLYHKTNMSIQNTSIEKNLIQNKFEETMKLRIKESKDKSSVKYNQFKFYAGKKQINLSKRDESSFLHKTIISKY